MKIEPLVERFLELPKWVVLVALWFAGLAVLAPLVLAFYLSASALVRMVLGT